MSSPAGEAQPIVVLPIGALEQHGRHLPLATDTMIAEALSSRAAAALGARLLPAIPFSMSECHGLLPGSVWLKPATLASVLGDVCRALFAQGYRRLLVINGHGGNFILEPAIQALQQELPGMVIALAPESWPEGEPAIFEKPEDDLHAGEIETSLLLSLHPELVKAERIDHIPGCGREFLDYVPIDRLSPEGIWGSPSLGEAGKGEQALALKVQAVVAFARQAFEGVP